MHRAKEHILIVDDEPAICEMMAAMLSSDHLQADQASDGEEAIRRLKRKKYNVCIVDLRMPKIDGLGVLRYIHENCPGTLGILSTGYSTMESAVEALRYGAFDYIIKPIHTLEIKKLVERALVASRNRRIAGRPRGASGPGNGVNRMMIGVSSPMQEIQELIRCVANSDSTALVLGESGTGKELVARTIHHESPRTERAMIPVNCGALPENLLESELFGHVKGAFTGAISDRLGRFQLADGGTIFLDEVGEMTPQLQVRLLRVLQEGHFEMVGSTQTTNVDVRVIAATHCNLEDMVEQRRFREDLYYRLNVIPIRIPPLRERMDDLQMLIDHFVAVFCLQRGRHFEGFTDEALDAMRRHPWPGNVRELENLIERCVILFPDHKVDIERLPEKFREAPRRTLVPVSAQTFPDEGIDLKSLVDDYEAQLIGQALEKAKGVKNRAAQLLGIKRTTLVEKMKKKGLM